MGNVKKSLIAGSVFLALIVSVMGVIGCGEKEGKTLPEIGDVARKHFDRGMAAVEMAASSNDYEDAITEFKKAVEFAPGWTNAVYNLAIVQEKAGDYEDAMANLKIVMESATSKEEVAEIRSLINKIEYKVEKKKEEKYEYVEPVAVAVEEETEPIVIPEINAWVDNLRFYGKSVDYGSREYAKYFPKNTTRYVYGELNLKHPDAPFWKTDFELEVVYIKPNGDVFTRFTVDTYIESGWTSSYHTFSWGWDTPGYWQTGWFQVEVYYKGNLIASEQFSVY